jgi:hypothetical protein
MTSVGSGVCVSEPLQNGQLVAIVFGGTAGEAEKSSGRASRLGAKITQRSLSQSYRISFIEKPLLESAVSLEITVSTIN